MDNGWTRGFGALTILATALLAGPARAHPGHGEDGLRLSPEPLRTWRLVDGRALTGSFVAERVGRVRLRESAGQETVLALQELSRADQEWVQERTDQIRLLNGAAPVRTSEPAQAAQEAKMAAPAQARPFQAFKKLKVTWDARWLYVESDGMPEHPMMKGIRSWQQQVPLPQPYTGANAWRIPLKPALAEKPVSARTALFRGAIALAVNGVPIFNALNNRGEDAYLAGELDEWGGHCGRADDYHYHMAPLHLEKLAGKGQPIAYALDGFPIYGLTNPDGSPVGKLDSFNGKTDEHGNYRYHATKNYPYVNGGLRGVVEVRDDQVEPQPRAAPVRPALPPLRGATITDFQSTGENRYRLTATRDGKTLTVDYAIEKDGTYRFTFDDGAGTRWTETYRRPP